MSDINPDYPYKTLGARLRGMRERLRETMAEVAGSVEIEVDILTNIEKGKDRPSEDILLLLISHFAVKEDEATKLWDLAGYDQSDTGNSNIGVDQEGIMRNTVLVMPIDARIIYTDSAHATINNHGVVLNFLQSGGPNNQPLVISRLGMSHDNAQSLLELLQATLSAPKTHNQPPKSLPATTPTEVKAKKTDKDQ